MNKKMTKINIIRIDDRRKFVILTTLILKYNLWTNVIGTNVIITNIFLFVITNIIRTANIPYKIWFYEMALLQSTFEQWYNIANDIKTNHIKITAD